MVSMGEIRQPATEAMRNERDMWPGASKEIEENEPLRIASDGADLRALFS